MKLSAVILVKNEEKNIKKCIQRLSFCDEVVVIDDCSTDKTKEIAKKLKANVFTRDMNKNYSEQSNYGMDKAIGDWVLFIDADEIVTKELAKEIRKAIKNNIDCFYIKRSDLFIGKLLKYGEVRNVFLPRLIKKGKGEWKRRVHPYFQTSGKVSRLKNPLLHYRDDLRSHINSINTWSSWHAMANKEEAKRANLFKIIFWPIVKFIRNYFFRLGILDGVHGFVHAFIMSFHSFIGWSKQWLKEK